MGRQTPSRRTLLLLVVAILALLAIFQFFGSLNYHTFSASQVEGPVVLSLPREPVQGGPTARLSNEAALFSKIEYPQISIVGPLKPIDKSIEDISVSPPKQRGNHTHTMRTRSSSDGSLGGAGIPSPDKNIQPPTPFSKIGNLGAFDSADPTGHLFTLYESLGRTDIDWIEGNMPKDRQSHIVSTGFIPDVDFYFTYNVGDRSDYGDSVAPALRKLGLKKRAGGADATERSVGVYWGENAAVKGPDDLLKTSFLAPDFLLSKNVAGFYADRDLVSGIPYFMELIGLKPGLARVYAICIMELSFDECDFTNAAYNVRIDGTDKRATAVAFEEGHVKRWKAEVLRHAKDEQIWIIKPKFMYNSNGIFLTELNRADFWDSSNFKKWASKTFKAAGDYTLQRYIENPVLYHGRKVDFRVWAVVTSFNPLRVYLLDHAFPKVASAPFSLKRASLKNPCVHWRLPSGSMCDVNDIMKPYPPHTNAAEFREGLQFKTGLDIEWDRDIMPAIASAVLRALLSAWQSVRPLHERIEQGTRGSGYVPYRRFLFLSPDISISDEGKVSVIEVNTNGYMVGQKYKHFYPSAQGATLAVLRLLGVPTYDRTDYEASFSSIVNDFCKSVGSMQDESSKGSGSGGGVGTVGGCSAALVASMWEGEDERRAAGGELGWNRIFPTPPLTPSRQKLQQLRKQRAVATAKVNEPTLASGEAQGQVDTTSTASSVADGSAWGNGSRPAQELLIDFFDICADANDGCGKGPGKENMAYWEFVRFQTEAEAAAELDSGVGRGVLAGAPAATEVVDFGTLKKAQWERVAKRAGAEAAARGRS